MYDNQGNGTELSFAPLNNEVTGPPAGISALRRSLPSVFPPRIFSIENERLGALDVDVEPDDSI